MCLGNLGLLALFRLRLRLRLCLLWLLSLLRLLDWVIVRATNERESGNADARPSGGAEQGASGESRSAQSCPATWCWCR